MNFICLSQHNPKDPANDFDRRSMHSSRRNQRQIVVTGLPPQFMATLGLDLPAGTTIHDIPADVEGIEHARTLGGVLFTVLIHAALGPPGWRCTCGTESDDYYAHAEHMRLAGDCPRCESLPVDKLGEDELYRWRCGHWIARNDPSAELRETS